MKQKNIDGKIEEWKTPEGGIIYRGWCLVKRQTITAGTVLNSQIPDGPPQGWKRITLKWIESRAEDGQINKVAGAEKGGIPTYESRVDFEILDYKDGTHAGYLSVEATVPMDPIPAKTAGRRSTEGDSYRNTDV